ncbi:MAG TPA: transporter associated domain-containing protein [Aromatoleum sp.]|uniref:HlyC/CorC family transporter n=1 Tax=Aromatoleum sp. TaxID=2307007 RepID=UPI002B487290|nr:transporter associated domain-containing protein [Aromatoleum sp.]HJV25337.1 transporter associated domain-containing protein [Aromatoleum sp.]
MDSSSPRPSLLERLSALLTRAPDDREELVALLHSAFERQLLDADAMSIMEGALQMSELQVGDVMIPRPQMDVIRLDDPIESIVRHVIDTGHSRFPVIGDGKDDIVGIFLAKDLLRYFAGHAFDLRSALRPAVFVPETKRLNVLLREFRISRNHMAIVVDEYGSIAGLATIEDVLEQIVGDIEDEYDDFEPSGNIQLDPDGRYRVQAVTEISEFNAAFGTVFSDAEVDTVGGLVMRELGRVPRRGEIVLLDGLRVTAVRVDGRRLQTLLVQPVGQQYEAVEE